MASRKVIVVGDIHGDLNQLLYPLMYFLKNFDTVKYIIFLGDYIDRGESNAYIYAIVKILRGSPVFKNKVILLRGNHETYDMGTYDYMSDNCDFVSANETVFILSFLFEAFKNMKLELFHYDPELDILFSHSPTSIPKEKALSLMKQADDPEIQLQYTYTYDKEHSGMEYYNIHGHIHERSTDIEISDFAHGRRKMISLDADSSYGIKLVENACKRTKRWVEDTASNVFFLVIEIKDDSKGKTTEYNIVTKNINFLDPEDYNTKEFANIKNALLNASLNRECKDAFQRLSLDDVKEEFRKTYLKLYPKDETMTNILENINQLYQQNMNKKKGINIYFHDVPFEIYNMFGVFTDMVFRPIYELYHLHVLKGCDTKALDRKYNLNKMIDAAVDKVKVKGSNSHVMLGGGRYAKAMKLLLIAVIVSVMITVCFIMMQKYRSVRVRNLQVSVLKN